MTDERGIRVVIASGVRGDTRRYRTFHLYEQAALMGVTAVLTHITAKDFPSRTSQADLLVLHRAGWDAWVQNAIENTHLNGGKVIYDSDDLLFDPAAFKFIDSPDFADPLRAGLYKEEMERHRHTITLCDAIMTSTNFLAHQAAGFRLPTFVHRNAFSNEMLTASERAFRQVAREPGKIIIGYASGTPTHDRDFEMIGPTLRRILDEHKHVSLWLVGPIKLQRGWAEYRIRIIHLPLVPWRLLPGYLSRFDINLAPLIMDNPFAQSKSEIKWMETALVRVPTVASATDAYRCAIRQAKTGFLSNSPAEWHEVLTELIQDTELRKKVGAAAYDQVTREYCPQARATELQRILSKMLVKRKAEVKTPPHGIRVNESFPDALTNKDLAVLEKEPSLVRLAGYALRNRGVATLAKQVLVYLRRLISPLIPYRKKRTDGGWHG